MCVIVSDTRTTTTTMMVCFGVEGAVGVPGSGERVSMYACKCAHGHWYACARVCVVCMYAMLVVWMQK